jgi:hypothetical protein
MTAIPVLLYTWFLLPSGRMVEVRKITGDHKPVVVVRYVNDNGELAHGEFVLLLSFLVQHGKAVAK